MNDYWPAVIGRQLAAAIQMTRAAIGACPVDLWDDRTEGSPFWHIAYHSLFYTDLYLSDDVASFQAREFHTEKAHFLPGDRQEDGGVITTPEKVFGQAQLLEYAEHCLRKSDEAVKKLTSERVLERCGFPWYPLSVGEMFLVNLRHNQHHTGQLLLLLRRRANIGIDWTGTMDNEPPTPTWG
ncbi:DinB family protein [Paludibaculum fermentans]|uniref:DinB family protein n=1 Tax=Paludibaculum fermentans TaxID=1473598 RepID=UPI003EC13382